jgi:hypothetical protein
VASYYFAMSSVNSKAGRLNYAAAKQDMLKTNIGLKYVKVTSVLSSETINMVFYHSDLVNAGSCIRYGSVPTSK